MSRFVVIIARLVGVSVSGILVLKLGVRSLYLVAGVTMAVSAGGFLMCKKKP